MSDQNVFKENKKLQILVEVLKREHRAQALTIELGGAYTERLVNELNAIVAEAKKHIAHLENKCRALEHTQAFPTLFTPEKQGEWDTN